MARDYAPFVRKIEVETENLDMVREAVEAGADIIMLDNMTPEQMKEAVKIIDGRAKTECSGNVTKENIDRLINIGVDYISSGALHIQHLLWIFPSKIFTEYNFILHEIFI